MGFQPFFSAVLVSLMIVLTGWAAPLAGVGLLPPLATFLAAEGVESLGETAQESGETRAGAALASAQSSLYLVVDVSAGPDAAFFPVAPLGTAPADLLTNDAYKTTHIVLRRIPAGTSIMGSPPGELGRSDDETQHQVTLTQDFYLGVFQITQAHYRNVTGRNPSAFTGAARPVERVSWNNVRGGEWPGNPPGSGQPAAGTFVARMRAKTGLFFDLPTEAQWEYACRAGTTTSLNSGEDITTGQNVACPSLNEVGRYWSNWNDGKGGFSGAQTAVGSYRPNAWGLYDMHGNVWEWCLDWYARYPEGPVSDPLGPSSAGNRVLRGGSWNNSPVSCRSAHRTSDRQSKGHNTIGFRLSCVTQPEQWTLSVLAPTGQGTNRPATGTHALAVGKSASATAKPAAGWAFSHWLLDGANAGRANPITIPGGAAWQTRTLRAVFAEVPHEWTLSVLAPTGQGTNRPATGSHARAVGRSASATAKPAAGWEFSHWLLDGANAGSANRITIPGGAAGQTRTLRAVFAKDKTVAPYTTVGVSARRIVGPSVMVDLRGHASVVEQYLKAVEPYLKAHADTKRPAFSVDRARREALLRFPDRPLPVRGEFETRQAFEQRVASIKVENQKAAIQRDRAVEEMRRQHAAQANAARAQYERAKQRISDLENQRHERLFVWFPTTVPRYNIDNREFDALPLPRRRLGKANYGFADIHLDFKTSGFACPDVEIAQRIRAASDGGNLWAVVELKNAVIKIESGWEDVEHPGINWRGVGERAPHVALLFGIGILAESINPGSTKDMDITHILPDSESMEPILGRTETVSKVTVRISCEGVRYHSLYDARTKTPWGFK